MRTFNIRNNLHNFAFSLPVDLKSLYIIDALKSIPETFSREKKVPKFIPHCTVHKVGSPESDISDVRSLKWLLRNYIYCQALYWSHKTSGNNSKHRISPYSFQS